MADLHDPLSSHAPPRAYDAIEDARAGAERARHHGQLTEMQRDTLMLALDTLALVQPTVAALRAVSLGGLAGPQ